MEKQTIFMKMRNPSFVLMTFMLLNIISFVSAFNFEGDGVKIIEPLTNLGDVSVVNRPFYFDAVLGKVPGTYPVRQFGTNPSINSDTDADIWDAGDMPGAELYNFSSGVPGIGAGATADIDTISSSSASDTNQILVVGLDVNGDLTEQIITLNGQNKVYLNTSLWRMQYALNINSTPLVGDVYIYVNNSITAGVPDTVGLIRAKIRSGNGITRMAIYTVPRNKVAIFTNMEYTIVKKTAAIASISPILRSAGGAWLSVFSGTVSSTGSPFIQELSIQGEYYDEFTDFVTRASVSTNDVEVGSVQSFMILDKTVWGLD